MLKCIRSRKDGVVIDILVTPDSRKEGFSYDEGGERLRVWVSEPASKGKANKAILKKFSKIFGNCEIISGKSSRRKTILIKGACIEEVKSIFRRLE